MALTSIAGCSCSCGGSKPKTFSRTLFGTDIALFVEVYGARDHDALFEKMSKECDALNEAINPDLTTSDVYKFNSSIGEVIDGETNILGEVDKRYKIEVGRYVYELVTLGIQAYSDTNGSYSVTVKELASIWGVDAEGLERVESTGKPNPEPSESQIAEAVYGVQNPLLIEPIVEDGKYYLIKDAYETTVDLGGIAKGYLADRLANIAQSHGVISATVDVGGTLKLVGLKPDAQNWKVGVRKPNKLSSDYICALNIPKNTAVSTSGTYERGYSNGRFYVSHILNPQTGYPTTIEKDVYTGMLVQKIDYVCSATVWGADAYLCDVMSTALCVLGKDGAKMIKDAGLSAVMFSGYGTMYLIGDVDFIEGFDAYKEYEAVQL